MTLTTYFLALGWACTGFWAGSLYRTSVQATLHAVKALQAQKAQQEKSEEYLHEIIMLKRKLGVALEHPSTQPLPTHAGQGGVL